MRLVVIGIPGSRRTNLLAEAARRFPGLTVELVPWIDLIAGRADLRRIVREGDVVRIDSPGKDAATERALLRVDGDEKSATAAFVSKHRVDSFSDDYGRIRWPSQWYGGLYRTMARVHFFQLPGCPQHRTTVEPMMVAYMFNKSVTHIMLSRSGVPVPPSHVPAPVSYSELVEAVRTHGWRQVFVKLSCSSSASGVIAIRVGREQIVAYTTVEIDGTDRDGFPKLYNTRHIRRLASVADVATVVDALCPHDVVVERWLPKAGIDGRAFDLRVVVIAGKACHVVPRLSRSPMTNLHLLNRRGDVDQVRRAVGEDGWAEAMRICERAVAAFPGTLYAGVDLMFQPGFVRPTVLEVNAFGDLLPGVLHDGMDTYTAELAATFGRPA
jgi:hypothetical protein